MNSTTKKKNNSLYSYVIRQKKLILLGVLSTLLLSLVELFTGSTLKYLTNLIQKFTDAYAEGFSNDISFPLHYNIKIEELGLKINIIDKTLQGNEQIFNGLLSICALFVSLFFLESLFNYGRRVFMNAATQRILLDFKSDIYQKILKLPFSFFSKNKTGDVVSRVTYDVNTLNEIIDLFIELARVSVYILVFIPFMFTISWKLTCFTLLFFPVSIALIVYITRYIKKVSRSISDNVGDYTAFLEEKINHYKLVKSYSKEESEGEEFDRLVKKNYKFNLRLIMLKYSLNPSNDFLSMLAVAVVYLFFSYQVTHGQTNVGDIVFFLYLMNTLFKPVKKVAEAWGTLHIALVSTNKIFDLLDESEEQISPGNSDKEPLETIESISFNKVSFSYPEDKRQVLHDITFSARKGDIVGIDGKSGAGKSTLLKLIPAFYKANSGEVLINGKNIDNFALIDLRSRVVIVDADNRIMNDSIRANIEYSGHAIDREKEAEYVQFLGLKDRSELDLMIGKNGIDLSEGQKQKISFLRAIAAKPSVLILDDAFSSLDNDDIHYFMQQLKTIDLVFLVCRKENIAGYASRNIKIQDGTSISN